MQFFPSVLTGLAMAFSPAMAGTVVITSLPDDLHPLSPVNSGGAPAAGGVEVLVGAFPAMTDDQILDAAATGGFPQVAAAFLPFGSPKTVGEGADGAAGTFEIAVHQAMQDPDSPCIGQEVSLLIRNDGNGEFLIARFKGQRFAVDPDTALEPLLSLHLADARIIVGNRYGSKSIATSRAPTVGSYTAWIETFNVLSDAAARLPSADPDHDGGSNLLEYATGGNPVSSNDPSPCQLVGNGEGGFWIRFSRIHGIGSASPSIEWSADLATPWRVLESTVEPDPATAPSTTGGIEWLIMSAPRPAGNQGFFRIKTSSGS